MELAAVIGKDDPLKLTKYVFKNKFTDSPTQMVGSEPKYTKPMPRICKKDRKN